MKKNLLFVVLIALTVTMSGCLEEVAKDTYNGKYVIVFRHEGCDYLKFGSNQGEQSAIHSETCSNPMHYRHLFEVDSIEFDLSKK